MEKEIWRKTIYGYEVSSQGKIRSLDRMVPSSCGKCRKQKGRILSPFLTWNGYPSVKLWQGEYQKNSMIHTLVALAFLGPRPSKKVINHKDGNKENNYFLNLEYISQSENILKAMGGVGWNRGSMHAMTTLSNLKVNKIRNQYAAMKITYRELGLQYNVSPTTIGRIVRKESWSWLPS